MQARCAEFSGHPPLGRVTGDAADPAQRPDVALVRAQARWTASGPSCPPGRAALATTHRSNMASSRVVKSNGSPHRTHLKKRVGRGDN